MSITEKWQSALDLIDDDRPENMPEWRAWNTCLQDIHDATTPRTPQPEWFGDPETEPGKWDTWWVELGDSSTAFWRECRVVPDPDPEFGTDNPMVHAWNRFTGRMVFDDVSAIVSCVPVAREGFPSPVSWGFRDGTSRPPEQDRIARIALTQGRRHEQ